MQLYDTYSCAPTFRAFALPSSGFRSASGRSRDGNPAGMCSGCATKRSESAVALGGEVAWRARGAAATTAITQIAPNAISDTRIPGILVVAVLRSRFRIPASDPFSRLPFPFPLERKHEQHSSPARPPREIGQRRSTLSDVIRQVRGHIAGDEEAHVAADARVDRDVLLAIRPQVRDGIADDAGADLELPQLLARARVHRLEPAVERAVEDDAARRRERAAPHGERLLDAPDFSPRRRIPRDELAAVSARAFFLRRTRADVGRSRDVGHGPYLEIHAEVVRRHVEQAGARRERGGL